MDRRNRRYGRLATVLAITAFMFIIGLSAIPAYAVSLANLIATDGSITVGDRIFSNFSFQANQALGTVNPTTADGINVSGLTIGGSAALQLGSFFVASTPTPNSALGLLVGYTVSTVSGAPTISQFDLRFNGTALGTGIANVTDTAFIPNTNTIIGQGFVQSPTQLSSALHLSGQFASVAITSSIGLFSGGNGSASFSFVQVSQPVPLPGTFLAFGAPWAIFAAWRWLARPSRSSIAEMGG
jgi:hypothetical protein